MDYSKKRDLKILNLANNELIVLQVLKGMPHAKVTLLAKKTKLPRTTVAFLLHNLQKRGLVKQIKIANHKEWQLTEDENLALQFRKLINNLEMYSEVIGKIEDKSLIIDVFRGEKRIIEAAKQILKFKIHERVYYIQSTSSARYQIAHFAEDFYIDFQTKLKKSGIVMEVIAAEGILPYFNKLSKKGLESHLGRPIISYLVPDMYVDFDADILLHQNNVMIINYKDESIIRIKNKLIAVIMMNLFELIKIHSRKIDLNEYIKELMAR